VQEAIEYKEIVTNTDAETITNFIISGFTGGMKYLISQLAIKATERVATVSHNNS
jgi:hypothetical protein